MHEWSLILALVQEVERQARAAGASRVTVVRVQAGHDLRLVPELLQRAFEVARTGSILDNARLELRVPEEPGAGPDGFVLEGISILREECDV